MTALRPESPPAPVRPGTRAPRAGIAAAVLAGVALRVLLALLAGRPELQSDEANYAYLGLALQRFGVLLDAHRYLWPPFYPWLLGEALMGFGADGGRVVHLLQALASGAIGAGVGLLAWRLGSRRAGVLAAWLWAMYVPLAGFTHLLWSETFTLALLVPALERLVAALQAPDDRTRDRRLLVAGALLGGSLWIKAFALYLVPLLALSAAAVLARHSGAREALRSAALLPLAALVCILPWGLRNLEVYGRWAPSGATLGENAYIGLNARYMNFDYVPLRRTRALAGLEPVEARSLAALVTGPAGGGWRRAEEVVHTVDRQRVQLRRGLDYAAEHPGWAARTRLKHLADLVTPLSFTTRHAALGLYAGTPLGAPGVRVVLVGLALVQSVLVLALGALGLARGLRSGAGAAVVLPVLAYVGASALLLSMSRLRLPAEPLLLVLAALFLVHGLEPARGPARQRLGWALGTALCAALAWLWYLNAPELAIAARDALAGGPA